jgi:hypothetical protein
MSKQREICMGILFTPEDSRHSISAVRTNLTSSLIYSIYQKAAVQENIQENVLLVFLGGRILLNPQLSGVIVTIYLFFVCNDVILGFQLTGRYNKKRLF